jgi:hypothetical protein
MNFQQQLDVLSKEFILNFNLRYTNNYCKLADLPNQEFIEKNKSLIDSSLYDFYNEINSFLLDWENAKGLPGDVRGNVKIISADKSLSDWKDIVYFEFDSPLRFFKILDQFASEACCGFYTTESKTESTRQIFYFDFHDEPVSLGIGIEGYIQMIVKSKGFVYWPKVLLDVQKKSETPQVKLMRESMPQIFPEFNFEEFIKTYQGLIK